MNRSDVDNFSKNGMIFHRAIECAIALNMNMTLSCLVDPLVSGNYWQLAKFWLVAEIWHKCVLTAIEEEGSIDDFDLEVTEKKIHLTIENEKVLYRSRE